MPYTLDDLAGAPGTELFQSGWVEVGPQDEEAFCQATFLREDFLGRRPSPVGAAGERAVSGFLLLSMLAAFHKRELRLRGGYALNYGLDRVRFVRPVPTGARVRVRAELVEAVEKEPGRTRVTTRNTMEVDDGGTSPRTAVIADWIMYVVTSG
ncbi:MaoC/PaaZ C-terminal domain-containing protein [Actinomadura atramentaria]|uniref:MaoC/PaaZ C-terminal domain-containing protein n=1 Tax=Actinomadura atramentaria TaxID=1990 RepID=UPI00037C3068|nr:MaoC/PaaZ C-terminal domain-containing protein [Actinomadura atramentaria]